MRLKKLFIIAIIMLAGCVGFFSGCTNKYENINIELSQETLTLSLSNAAGEEELKTATVNATLTNVPSDMLKNLTYSQTNTEVVLVDFIITADENVIEVEFTALSGGSSVVTIKHAESGKSADITINVVEKLNELYTITNGGAYAVVGETINIDTSKNVGFEPSTTTQKEIKYTLTSAVAGVSITESGAITVNADVLVESVDVTASSVANPNLATVIHVKIIKPISVDDIQIKSGGLNVNEIILSSEEGADNTLELQVQVATREDVIVTPSFSVAQIANIDAENEIVFNVSGENIGTTVLTFKVAIKNFEEYFVERNVIINVKQKPNQVKINNQVTLKHTFDIFDWYSNGLGRKINVQVNPVGASNKDVKIIVPEDAYDLLEFAIYDNDQKTVIDITDFFLNGNGEDIYVTNVSDSLAIDSLKNRLIGGETIEGIKLVDGNLVIDIKFYAYGCEEFSSTKIYANCEFTLKKGIKDISVNGLFNNTIYIKTGEITPLNISVDPIDSLIDDLQAEIQQEDIVEFVKTVDGVSLKGLKNGNTKITIFSETGATTSAIDLVCFTQALNFGIKAPTPDENGSVYQSNYVTTVGNNSMQTLNSIILARGAGIQLLCNTLPTTSTIVNISFLSSNTTIANVNSVGYVVGRGEGTCTITAKLSTYALENGRLVQTYFEKTFAITIINPIRSFDFLSKSVTVYNSRGLGYYGLEKELNTVLIPLSIDSITATCVNNGAIFSNLRLALSNNYNGELSAELLQDGNIFVIKITSNITSTFLTSDLYLTLTATLQDYSRYFIQTCQIIVKSPIRISEISTTNVEENNEIYLEGRNGLNEYSNTTNYEEGQYENTFKIQTKTLPINATNQNVKYVYYGTNDNKDVCYIQKDGTIIPFRAGSAKFRIIPEDSFIQDFDGSNYNASLGLEYIHTEITVVIADGTQANPYLIKTAEQLQNINNALDKYYVLTNDINLTGYSNFVSIGANTTDGFVGGLNGKYNGVTYSVLGLRINNNNAKNGLFAKNNGTIENLKLEIASINYAAGENESLLFGGLVTENNNIILNCSVSILTTNISGELDNIVFGGLVGKNNGTISGDFTYFSGVNSTTTAFGNINISATVQNNSAVGGVVGENFNKIENVKSELSIIADNLNNVGGVAGTNEKTILSTYYSANVLYGNENVGGIVGLLKGVGTINDSVVEIFTSSNIATFMAKNNLGGLVGNADGTSLDTPATVQFSFVRNYGIGRKVLCLENSSFTDINIGGLVGKANNLLLNKSYSNIQNELVLENQTLNFGGLIGSATNSELENVYAQGEHSFDFDGAELNVGGLIGAVNTVTINFAYSTVNFIDETDINTTFNGLCSVQATGNYCYYEEKSNNQYGFGTATTDALLKEQSTFENWNFVTTWTINSGINSNYPYLKRENNSAFLTDIPISILLTLKDNVGIKLTTNNLNLDNSNTIVASGNKIILPFIENGVYALNDLVTLTYEPADAQREFKITTSNSSVIAVDDANKLYLKSTGYAVITIFSSYTDSVFCSFEVCVSDLFNKMDIINLQGSSLRDESTLNIKKNSFENIYVSLFNNGNEIFFNSNFGIYYSSENTTDLKINNQSMNDWFTYAGTNVLQAQNTMNANTQVQITAIPYFKVVFDETEYIIYIKDEAINFDVNIYLGVDDIYLNETENEISLKNQLAFSLFVKSDLPSEEILINKQLFNGTEYENVIDNSNKDYIQITQTNKTTLSNDYVKYDYQLSVKEQFLQYVGEGTNLFNENQIIKLNFCQKESESRIATYTLTLLPQKVLKIDINHYPAGEVQNFGGTTSYYPQELPDNRINPGKQGILKLNVYPNFSNFDYLEITSTLDDKSNRVYFQQVVFDETTNSYVVLHPAYNATTYGINLKPVSYADGTFDGSIFVKTLIISKVDKGTKYNVQVTAYKDDVEQYVSEPLTLFAENLPGITLLYGTSTKGYVAKNTTSSALNFEITDYDGAEGLNFIAIAKQGNEVLNNVVTVARIGNTNNCTLIVEDAPVGSVIYVSAQISRTVNGLRETSSSTVVLTVVDFLINSVKVDGADVQVDNSSLGTLQMNLGSQIELKAKLQTVNGPSVQSAINNFETIISNDFSNWFYVRSRNASTGVTITENIILNQIYSNFAVVNSESGNYNYLIQAKKVSTNSMLQLVVNYGYTADGQIAYNKNGVYYNLLNEVVTVADVFEHTFNFNLKIVAISELTNPIPVSSADEFMAMEKDLDYILMQDIVLGTEIEPYNALSTAISSFDGNGYIITIDYLNTSDDATVGKYGLFSTVDSASIIKNVIVKYSNKSINLNGEKEQIYFGGIAGENNGVITNCDVIKGDYENLNIVETTFNLFTFVGGFVGVNNGYITNSRVGNINNAGLLKFSAPVNVAGFVCQNNGKITSCYVGGNIEINNTSNQASGISTAGFVGDNSGTISFSFVEGYAGNLINVANGVQNGVVKSSGNVSGFVYSNNATINDCYSLIKLETHSGRIAGFVYNNKTNAKISNSYSACTFEVSEANMNFAGNNEYNEIQAKEEDIINCYYFVETKANINYEEVAIPVTSAEFGREDSFGSLFIDNGGNWAMGVYWLENTIMQTNISNENATISTTQVTGIRPYLVTTRTKSVSNRVLTEGDESVFPYWYEYSNQLGSEINPILVSTAEEFIFYLTNDSQLINGINYNHIRIIKDIDLGQVADTDMKKLQDIIFAGKLDGNSMTVSNLRIISTYNTDGLLSFGMFKQIGLDFMQENINNNKVEKFDENIPDISKRTIIKNIKFEIAEVAATDVVSVGVLSGEIINSTIVNVNLVGEGIVVEGRNMVGALAGRVSGDSKIFGVSSNLSIRAMKDYAIQDEQNIYAQFDNRIVKTTNLENNYITAKDSTYSFAGGIVGVIDIYQIDFSSAEENIFAVDRKLEDLTITTKRIELTNCNLSALKTYGSMEILGTVAGGVAGYIGSGTVLNNGSFELKKQTLTNENQKIIGKYASGGLIGASKGYIYKSKVAYENAVQQQIDDEILNSENGTGGYYGTALFFDEQVDSKYVGGLIGIQIEGTIADCYSRANIINRNAEYAGGLVGRMYYFYNQYNSKALYETPKVISTYTTANVLARQFKASSQVGEADILAGKAGGSVGNLFVQLENIEIEDSSPDMAILYGIVSANNWKIETKDIVNTGAIVGEVTANEFESVSSIFNICKYASSILNDGTSLKLNFGTSATNNTQSAKYIDYLNHRTNSSFPTTLSIFNNYDDSIWDLQSHSMPTLNVTHLSKSLIRTEEDLFNILPNGYYVLVNDIYLSDYWKPSNVKFSGVLTSLKTEESTSDNPKYYTIYNLNIDSTKNGARSIAVDETQEVASGLFAQTQGATFMNFNIVVGTRTDKSNAVIEKLTDCAGIKMMQNQNNSNLTYNVGVLSGRAVNTTVLNVNIKFKEFTLTQNSQTSILPNFVSDYNNIGGFFGYADNCELQSNCIIEDMKISCVSNTNTVERNIGGIAGAFLSSVINESSQEGLVKTIVMAILKNGRAECDFINVDVKTQALSVGTMFGKLSLANLNSSKCKVFEDTTTVNIKVKNSSVADSTFSSYIGGLIGQAEYVDYYGNDNDFKNIKIILETDEMANSNMIVGGAFAKANNCIIKDIIVSTEIQCKDKTSILSGNVIVGGLAGEVNSSEIKNVGINANIIIISQSVCGGGLVGIAQNTSMTACAVLGTTEMTAKAQNGNNYYGNFAGQILLDSNIVRSFADVKGKLNFNNACYTGGFAGIIKQTTIDGCYAIGYLNLIFKGDSIVMGGFAGNIESVTFEDNLTYTATMLKTTAINGANVGPFAGTSTDTIYGENIVYLYGFIGAVKRASALITEYATEARQEDCLENLELAITFEADETATDSLQLTTAGTFYNPIAVETLTDITADKFYILENNITVESFDQRLSFENTVLNGNAKNIIIEENKTLPNNIIWEIDEESAILNLGIIYQNTNITNNGSLSFFADTNKGLINQCYVAGTVKVDSAYGISGFVDINNGFIYSSATSVIVDINKKVSTYINGFVMNNNANSIIYNSFTTSVLGTIIKDSENTASGFVSVNDGKICNIYTAAVLNTGKAENKYSIFMETRGIVEQAQYDSNTIVLENSTTQSIITSSVLKSGLSSTNQINYNYGYPLLNQFSSNFSYFDTGDGTEEKPFKIQSLTRFELLKDIINDGGDVYYLQICDFDLINKENYFIKQSADTFKYDGGSFAIHNLMQKNTSNGGLFKTINAGCVIKNLGLINVDINIVNSGNTGTFASTFKGTLNNCYAKGKMEYEKGTGLKTIGGLVGSAQNATITNCYAEMIMFAKYNGTTTSTLNIGGIVGEVSTSTLTNLIVAGSIKDYKRIVGVTSNIAGIAGRVNSGATTVDKCYIITSLLTSEVTSSKVDFANINGIVNASNIIAVSDYTLTTAKMNAQTQLKTFTECMGSTFESGFTSQTKGLAYISSIKDKRCFNIESGSILNPTEVGTAAEFYQLRKGELGYIRLTNNIEINITGSMNDIENLQTPLLNHGIIGSGYSIINNLSSDKIELFGQIENMFVSNLTLSNIAFATVCENLIANNFTINGATLTTQGAVGTEINNSYINDINVTSNALLVPKNKAIGLVSNSIVNSYIGQATIRNNTISTNATIYTLGSLAGISGNGSDNVFENNSITFGTTENPIDAVVKNIGGLLIETSQQEHNSFIDVYGVNNNIDIVSNFSVLTVDVSIGGLIAILDATTTLNVTGEVLGKINHVDSSINASNNKYYVGGFVGQNKGNINGGINRTNINVKIAEITETTEGYVYLTSTDRYKDYDEETYKFITQDGQIAYEIDQQNYVLDVYGRKYYAYYNQADQKLYAKLEGTTYTNEIVFVAEIISKEITLYKKVPQVNGLNFGTELPAENTEDYAWVCIKAPKTNVVDGKTYFVTDNNGFVMVDEIKMATPDNSGWYYALKDDVLQYDNSTAVTGYYEGDRTTPVTTNCSSEYDTQSPTGIDSIYYREKNLFLNWRQGDNVKSMTKPAPVQRSTTSYVGGICGFSFTNSQINNTRNAANVYSLNNSSISNMPVLNNVELFDQESKTGYVSASGINDIKNFAGGIVGFAEHNPLVPNNNNILTGNSNNAQISAVGGKRYFQYDCYTIYDYNLESLINVNAFALGPTTFNGITAINSLAYAGSVYGGNLAGAVDINENCEFSFNIAILSITYTTISGQLNNQAIYITIPNYDVMWETFKKNG